MTKPTWKILDRGAVPVDQSKPVEFTCPGCGRDAILPVVGMAIAQFANGLVFDTDTHEMPACIQCRYCRRRFELLS